MTKTIQHNIPWAKPQFFGEEKSYLMEALESSWISGGKYVDQFERDFTKINQIDYGVSTSNGTTALYVALLALEIRPGDEVIVPAYTFTGPVNMVITVGAKPVYADVDPRTWCIDPQSVEQLITDKTRAILPVHTYGNVCAMNELKALAQKHKLFIIEDTAEAACSKYNGQYAGTIGDIGCFSFQATKTISMGEGGAVLTANKDLYDTMVLLRNHGMSGAKRYWHHVIGHNFRLTNLQAAVGCGQLKHLTSIIEERQRVYQNYCQHLNELDGVDMQHFAQAVDPVVWAVAVKIDPNYFIGNRDVLMEKLKEVGVETRPGFYTCHEMPIYQAPRLNVAQDVADNMLVLPSYSSLQNQEIEYICHELKKLRK